MKKYSNMLPRASFPLGGIGTGTISLEPNGHLNDFQIFNRPSLGCKVPYTFFSLYSKIGDVSDARVVEAPFYPDFYLPHGYHSSWVAGLPRFKSSEMEIRYPFAHIDFKDEKLPLSVALTASSPFCPLNEDDSGIPGIIFNLSIKNESKLPAELLSAFSMGNIHNFSGVDVYNNLNVSDNIWNEIRNECGFEGLFMTGNAVASDDARYADSTILVPAGKTAICASWYRGGWYDGVIDFWHHFSKGALPETQKVTDQFSVVGPRSALVGTVAQQAVLKPGESCEFKFFLTWYVPNRPNGWPTVEKEDSITIKNHYAVCYESSWAAAVDLAMRENALNAVSKSFSECLYSSTLSDAFINCMEENLCTLRSTTVWRDRDGTMMGWEGSHAQSGSCHGTCTHVWNYAQAMAFLFPRLEKSARENELFIEMTDDGKIPFRAQKRFNLPEWEMYPAVDGQLGTIMRVYREWKNTGDLSFLKKSWHKVQKAFAYICDCCDLDRDGIVDARQHNTYDIEFFGPNPMIGIIELGALRALEKMAEELQEYNTALKYRKLYEKARSELEKLCWNGEYYVQALEDYNSYPYQFGNGCLSDQLFGQTLAYVCGLGDLLPKEHLHSAIQSVYKYNELDGSARDICFQRLYVADDERGLVLCSWPHGDKPNFPFVYCNEVWTGVEYQLATSMMCLGMVEEAIDVVEAVRSRYDGIRRNPWNDIECGFYYSRSMAAWGMMSALSGIDVHNGLNKMTINRIPMQEKLFFSAGTSWGTMKYKPNELIITVANGETVLKTIQTRIDKSVVSIHINGREIRFITKGNICTFEPVELKTGSTMIIRLA